MYRLEVTLSVKPGRLEDAIVDMNAANEATQRLAGVTGQMFLVTLGAQAFGGARLCWDFESIAALGRFEEAAISDQAFQTVIARVLGSDTAWIIPAAREGLQQVV
jgi:hypothetical protein